MKVTRLVLIFGLCALVVIGGLSIAQLNLGRYQRAMHIGNLAVKEFRTKNGRWPRKPDELLATPSGKSLMGNVPGIRLTESPDGSHISIEVLYPGPLGREFRFVHNDKTQTVEME
jgi:hypothetical protein